MDLELTEEHEALRATVEDFARKEVAPVIGGLYERGEFPYGIVARMGAMGLFGLPIAEEYGGMGGDYFALCLALEELARVDSSVAITLEAGVSLGAMPIYRFGTEEQKREWLPALAAGEQLGAFGPHRGRRRLRRGRDAHHRAPRRRRVGDQRLEGVHHELGHRHHLRHHRHRDHR
jgi:alkylation response protein AidB-like acyl-CoA dehydrogenase